MICSLILVVRTAVSDDIEPFFLASFARNVIWRWENW